MLGYYKNKSLQILFMFAVILTISELGRIRM